MTWKLRHEGSPRAIEGLTLQQVVEGMRDGLWEPTDEIMEDTDRQWVSIESHPKLEEIVADLENPLDKPFEEETRLDMNPLIDVALVLLIFFIITTSYAALQKVLEMAQMSDRSIKDSLHVVNITVAQKTTIFVKSFMENGKPVIQVEDERVEPKNLVGALRHYVESTNKAEVLIDAAPDVDWGTVVTIQDAAKGAGIERAHLVAKHE